MIVIGLLLDIVGADNTYSYFCVRRAYPEGRLSHNTLNRVYSDGTKNSSNATAGLRPVFTLKPEIKMTGGEGTTDNPYILNI